MANDCLVTKLKGTIQNENLPYFNALLVEVNARKSISINPGSAPINTSVKLVGNGHLESVNGVDLGKTYSFPGTGAVGIYAVSDGESCKVHITPKYTFDSLLLQGNASEYEGVEDGILDLSQFIYNNTLYNRPFYNLKALKLVFTNIESLNSIAEAPINFVVGGGTFMESVNDICLDSFLLAMDTNPKNQAVLQQTSALALVIQNNTLVGTNTRTAPYINLSTLDAMVNVIKSNFRIGMKGDIKYLYKVVHDGVTAPTVYTEAVFYPYVTGSLEELVSFAQSKGRTTGKINIEFLPRWINVTYQGQSLSNLTITASAKNYIAWDAQGNITIGNNA